MPTIIKQNGLRLFFYSNEQGEPPHIHVQCGTGVAKYWIFPVRLAKNAGLDRMELRRAAVLVEQNEQIILETWNGYFNEIK